MATRPVVLRSPPCPPPFSCSHAPWIHFDLIRLFVTSFSDYLDVRRQSFGEEQVPAVTLPM